MIRHLWCRAHYKTPGCRRSRTFYVKLPLYLIQSDPIRIGSIHLLRTRVISITYDVLLGADLNFEHSRDKVNQFFMCFTLAVQLHTQKVPLWIICAAFDFRYLHFFVRFEFGCRLLSVTGSFFFGRCRLQSRGQVCGFCWLLFVLFQLFVPQLFFYLWLSLYSSQK